MLFSIRLNLIKPLLITLISIIRITLVRDIRLLNKKVYLVIFRFVFCYTIGRVIDQLIIFLFAESLNLIVS